MRRTHILLTGAALTGTAAALVVALIAQPLPACRLQVIRDYVTPISFQAVLQLSDGCPPGTVLRVRKSSTMNVKRNGAPYQPILPENGAWEVGNHYSRVLKPVPQKQLWISTLGTPWRWEWWSANDWNTRTNSAGRWLPGEVIHEP